MIVDLYCCSNLFYLLILLVVLTIIESGTLMSPSLLSLDFFSSTVSFASYILGLLLGVCMFMILIFSGGLTFLSLPFLFVSCNSFGLNVHFVYIIRAILALLITVCIEKNLSFFHLRPVCLWI